VLIHDWKGWSRTGRKARIAECDHRDKSELQSPDKALALGMLKGHDRAMYKDEAQVDCDPEDCYTSQLQLGMEAYQYLRDFPHGELQGPQSSLWQSLSQWWNPHARSLRRSSSKRSVNSVRVHLLAACRTARYSFLRAPHVFNNLLGTCTSFSCQKRTMRAA